MTNLYAVVGEHHDDPNHFLVLGEDGQYYDWDLTSEQTRPVELGEAWCLDADVSPAGVDFEELFVDPPAGRLNVE